MAYLDSNGVARLWEKVKAYVNQQSSGGVTLDKVYPVGAIYMSVSNTSPATLFGGTWEQLKDRFLLSAGDSYAAGATGGEAVHALTSNEMPVHNHSGSTASAGGHGHTASTASAGAHTHKIDRYKGAGNGSSRYGAQYGSGDTFNSYSAGDHTHSVTVNSGGAHTHTVTINNSGGGAAHNNMPPYLTVYMWKRTA